jgi:hypothetical protein
MARERKPPNAAIAAFAFAVLYVGISLFTELPVLWSRPIALPAAQQTAVRTGQIVGVLIECAVIAGLGFAIFNERVWAAWWLFALAVMEIILVLARRDFIDGVLPLILACLALWAADSLRVRKHMMSIQNRGHKES